METKFNPSSPEYKKVQDLPKERQAEFADIPEEEGGGFVRKSARDPILEAKIEEIVKNDPTALERKLNQLHEEALKIGSDREAVLKLLESSEPLPEYGVLWSFNNDREVMLKAVEKNIKEFLKVSSELRLDPEFVLEAIKNDATVLRYVTKEFRGNREFMLKAIEKNGCALEWVSDEISGDLGFLLEVAKRNPKALAYASEYIQIRLGIEK